VLRLGELVGAIGGLGLLVATFLPWYSFGEAFDLTAWQAFSITDVFLAVTAVVGMSVAACVLAHISVSYPVAGSAVAALCGAIAVVLIVYRLVNPPGDDLNREIGAWLGLIAAAAIAHGGYLGMQPMKTPRAVSA
jgi:hypothetical protein